MAALPSNFRFCNFPHTCFSKFEGTALPLSDGFRNWKNALCKTKCFCKHVSSLCHKHAVTMLTQPGHIGGVLKEQLKSQKEENRNCHLKIVQSISHLCKGKQDENQISSSSSFSELKMMECSESGLKSLMISICARMLRMKYFISWLQ